MTTKFPAAKTGKNMKSPRSAAPSLRQYRQDDDLASQPDTEYSRQSRSPRYAPENVSMPNLPQWHDSNGREGPSHHERRPEQRGTQQYDRFTSDPTLSALPEANLYEHILLLRKHGMSVKLDREAARMMSQPDLLESNNANNNSVSHSPLTDRYNPTRKEKQHISHALDFILRRGGEIDIPALEPQPMCKQCSEPFDTASEKLYHCDRARNRCKHCAEDFACLLMLKEHLKDDHKIYKHLSRDSWYSSGGNPVT
ncbi:hypothetical protein A1O7_07872 [Cladophialophora yegresii CBS 114405]|uniref:C2H2-type domain-containing protein n=1 Tax=Cladophialophora yegresii CBS 114405 TaxID=1182544 RepID=W9WG74_9EURO|nr:uncharacterized protein A1O7_07872 [Cladophialophora yegresii CBS 114405]EXJ57524.1 hypothetical protein A1O7_07872 [Cladophialophora yegresii CBS 114405]